MSRVMPPALDALIEGLRWRRDKIGESGATIHRLAAPGRSTLYLKHGQGRIAADIIDEFARLAWLRAHIRVPQVRYFAASGDAAWLLTEEMPGQPAYRWLCDHPGERGVAVASMARFLRRLHAIPADACPFNAALAYRLTAARANIAAGLVETEDFDDARAGCSAEQVLARVEALAPRVEAPVVTHGDFSLDNIFLDEGGEVVGCIDVGRVGLADRYQDLAILSSCLDEFDAALSDRLFAAYGVARDADRIELHLCLDELF